MALQRDILTYLNGCPGIQPIAVPEDDANLKMSLQIVLRLIESAFDPPAAVEADRKQVLSKAVKLAPIERYHLAAQAERVVAGDRLMRIEYNVLDPTLRPCYQEVEGWYQVRPDYDRSSVDRLIRNGHIQNILTGGTISEARYRHLPADLRRYYDRVESETCYGQYNEPYTITTFPAPRLSPEQTDYLQGLIVD